MTLKTKLHINLYLVSINPLFYPFLSTSPGPIYITSYTLHGLQPASLFEVSVLARNSFGWSDNSRIVRFATGGEGKFTTLLARSS